MATLSLGGALLAMKLISDASWVQENIVKKELQSKTLSPGTSAHGFVYVPGLRILRARRSSFAFQLPEPAQTNQSFWNWLFEEDCNEVDLFFFLAASLLSAILFSAVPVTLRAQTKSPEDTMLRLKAALVLTPDFCATKTKKGSFVSGKETFEIGRAACAELEPALKGVFFSLTRTAAPPSPEEAQVVLLPKFGDVEATKTLGAFSDREMIVLLEWTVKDRSGKTVWIETVQGSSKHHMGNTFTHGKNVKLIVEDSAKDAAEQSASKMSSSPELRKLAQQAP